MGHGKLKVLVLLITLLEIAEERRHLLSKGRRKFYELFEDIL
jgi:hypothetical protein